MAETTLRNKLIEMLRQERQAERDMVTSLSEETRNAVGVIDNWAVKNIITHMASAKFGMATDLAGGRQGQDVTPFNSEYRAFNDRTFTEHQNASWEEVNTYADAAADALIAEAQEYTDSELQQPNPQAWMSEGETVAANVFGIALGHTYKHIAELYAENGHADTVYALLESLITLHKDLGAPPQDVAGSHYDVAATYALVGRGDLAMPHLRAVVRDNPGMRDWVLEDRAFNSVRETAEFQAL